MSETFETKIFFFKTYNKPDVTTCTSNQLNYNFDENTFMLNITFFQKIMAEIAFVNVESEPVEVKQECVEEQDPLSTTGYTQYI